MHDLTTRIEADRFEVRFVAECRASDIDFLWRGQIQGESDGTITYRFAGESRSDFCSARIGFCVLHPVEHLPGQPCRVEHVDGTVDQGIFPEHIAPQQPFTEIRAITHEVQPGVSCEVRMAGETFEMEDQRNWTDASYKTYCRPLALPFPFAVAAGERIEQTVQLRLLGIPRSSTVSCIETTATLELLDPTGPLPAIGLGQATCGTLLKEQEADWLRLLRPAHLRVDLDLRQPALSQQLSQADQEATAIGADLELALHLSDAAEAELRALVAGLSRLRSRLTRFLVFHVSEKSTSPRWGQMSRRCLRPSCPDVPIGLGTDAFFAELNRDRPTARSGRLRHILDQSSGACLR